MKLFMLQSSFICIIFSILILAKGIKNPLTLIMSYPPKIRERAEKLYSLSINNYKKNHIILKLLVMFFIPIIFSIIAYLSSYNSFESVFIYVFALTSAVNLYDLIILDIVIFCNTNIFIIKGTEDMIKEYKNPMHHIRGFFIGIIICAFISLISALIVYLFNNFYK